MWHAGGPLTLRIVGDDDVADHLLGALNPQALVPAHAWQAANAGTSWALVSYVVTPGFEFAGFELAPPD